jgi:hypothetical protein
MRTSDLAKNHADFDKSLARYRRFMDKILKAKHTVSTAQEKRDISESVILRLCAHWEQFVDEHLVDCINRDHSQLKEFFGVDIPKNPSKNLCQALIYGDGYKDFHSFGDLKGFSKRILPDDSNPFPAVKKIHSEKIDEVYKMRNYLSHYSAKAKRSLLDMYSSRYSMTNFLKPGQFLLAYNGKRLWAYFDAFEGASRDMKEWYQN